MLEKEWPTFQIKKLTIISSNGQHNRRGIYDHLIRKSISTLTTNKILVWPPKQWGRWLYAHIDLSITWNYIVLECKILITYVCMYVSIYIRVVLKTHGINVMLLFTLQVQKVFTSHSKNSFMWLKTKSSILKSRPKNPCVTTWLQTFTQNIMVKYCSMKVHPKAQN